MRAASSRSLGRQLLPLEHLQFPMKEKLCPFNGETLAGISSKQTQPGITGSKYTVAPCFSPR